MSENFIINGKRSTILIIMAHLTQLLIVLLLIFFKPNFLIVLVIFGIIQVIGIVIIIYRYFYKVNEILFYKDGLIITERKKKKKIFFGDIIDFKICPGSSISIYKKYTMEIFYTNNKKEIYNISNLKDFDKINEFVKLHIISGSNQRSAFSAQIP